MRNRLLGGEAVVFYAVALLLLCLAYVSMPMTYSYFTPPPATSVEIGIPVDNLVKGENFPVGITVLVNLKADGPFLVGSPIQTSITVANPNPNVNKLLKLTNVTVYFAGGTNLTLRGSGQSFHGSASVVYEKPGAWTGTIYWKATVNGAKISVRPTSVNMPDLRILPADAWPRDTVAWAWFGGFLIAAVAVLAATVIVYRRPSRRTRP